MLHILISTIGILLTVIFVIGTHEAAHFMMARWIGVKILRFSIGFGKTLWRRTDKHGTEYVIALVPLGGYVKMLDEHEGHVPPEEKHLAFNQQPYYKKMLVVLAGPIMNILCALLLYWIIFMIGITTIKPIIGTVAPDSIADKAGLKPQQEIVMVGKHTTHGWTGLLLPLLSHAGDHDTLSIRTISPTTGPLTHSLDLSTWKLDGLAPDPLQSIGITPYLPIIPLVIGHFAPHSPAANTLQLHDKLLAIDNTPINSWDDLAQLIKTKPGQTLIFTIKRHDKSMRVPVTVGVQHQWFQQIGFLGISPDYTLPDALLNHMQYGPFQAMAHAAQQLHDFVYFNFILIGKLITGKISLQSLGGPITIFDSAGTALNIGLVSFLGFLAFLSVSIGVINLLPIPGLDGGHLLLQTIEWVIRRNLPDQLLSFFYKLGFGLILFILTVALVNDLLRLAAGI